MNLAIKDVQYLDLALKEENDVDKINIKFNEIAFEEVENAVLLEIINPYSLVSLDFGYKILFAMGFMHNTIHIFGNKFLPKLISPPSRLNYIDAKITAKDAINQIKTESYAYLTIICIFLFLTITYYIKR